MANFFTFLLPVTICIFIHEGGHYLAARYFRVGVKRASLFFNFIVTFLKYDPMSGRFSIISRREPVTVHHPNGYEDTVLGEWAWISIPVSRPIAPDYIAGDDSQIRPCSGWLVNKTVIKSNSDNPDVARWRRTQYCLGWIPCGGYVTLDTDNDSESLERLSPGRQLIINAAGVVCNLLTLVLVLTGLRLLESTTFLASHTFVNELFYIAIYSFYLFLLNILPLPGLDGGNIARNITAIVWPGHESTVAKAFYNIFGWVVFAFILSSWIRPISGFETRIFGFFNYIFEKILILWGL